MLTPLPPSPRAPTTAPNGRSRLLTALVLLVPSLAFLLVPTTPAVAEPAAESVVLHDCLLVFRFGNDPRYGVTLHGSEARDINDGGQAVGWMATPAGAVRAIRWQDGVAHDLGTLGGANSCALAINNAGQVVGWAETAGGEPRAVLWEEGRTTDLGTFPGTQTVAFAINEAGVIVGLAWTTSAQLTATMGRAVLWTDGEMIDLGATIGVPCSAGRGINERGEIVGWIVTAAGRLHAFRWSSDRLVDLGATGTARSEAFAVNDGGRVVGWAELAEGDGRHAVLWANDELIDLTRAGDDDGRLASATAYAIDERGQIVGSVKRLDGVLHPVVWIGQGAAPRDLGTLGGDKGEAYAINAVGQVVGWSTDGAGTPRAFVWDGGTMTNLAVMPVGASSMADGG